MLCIYCKEQFSNSEEFADHTTNCLWNPENKSCYSCEHEGQYLNGSFVCNMLDGINYRQLKCKFWDLRI
jgi:hypothetical protein